jgi:GAF domain-containing protein
MSEMRALPAFSREGREDPVTYDQWRGLERKIGALEESNQRLREELQRAASQHARVAGMLSACHRLHSTLDRAFPRRPSACVPMRVDGLVVGAIAIFSLADRKAGLGGADFDLLEMLGTHVGTALAATRGSISPA